MIIIEELEPRHAAMHVQNVKEFPKHHLVLLGYVLVYSFILFNIGGML